jgi:hypothetical protein
MVPHIIEILHHLLVSIKDAASHEPLWVVVVTLAFLISFVLIQLFRNNALFVRARRSLESNSRALLAPRDARCVWNGDAIFFAHVCQTIRGLKVGGKAPLYIYRGYDQGRAEPNNELRRAIRDAMLEEKISHFYRVVVITSDASIPIAVRWMSAFGVERLRSRCHFYVAFRRTFNLGSYVALGDDECFIAMPSLDIDLEIKGPSTTQSGIFVMDPNIAQIIRHYITNLNDMAAKGSVHVIPCPLPSHAWLHRRKLSKVIQRGFANFSNLERKTDLAAASKQAKRSNS